MTHTGAGTCAAPQFADVNAITRWIYTAWDWVAQKCNDWNANAGHLEITNDHCSYLLYLVAADISDSNLESNTARWYLRPAAAEAAAGAAVGFPSQAGANAQNQRAAQLGEEIVKAIHLALEEVCPNCEVPVDLGDG